MSHRAPVFYTLYASTAWCRKTFIKKLWKVSRWQQVEDTPRVLWLTAVHVLKKEKKAKENKRKLIRRAYLELFDVPWGDKAIRTREKCPGEGGVSASQTWWRGKVNHVFDTGSAKVICLRWQCWISVSLRMQPLFKSIRGLGLTVSGGRSPLLWGWGNFFSFLTKLLSIPIRWHRY